MEIISPGHLPDSLSTDAIRAGATNRRNPTLTEHAIHILPYRGLGTGIPRALQDWPRIDLIDDVVANQFRVIIRRPQTISDAKPAATEADLQMSVEIPEMSVETPEMSVETPEMSVETPEMSVEIPEMSVETPEMSVEMSGKILALLETQPQLTLTEVAELVGKSVRTVERASAQLVKNGRLRRVGPRKGGSWEVIP